LNDELQNTFRTLTVDSEHSGKRLDRFLVETIADLSRSRVNSMIELKQVRVNGRVARKGDPLSVGATVELLAPPPPKEFSPIPNKEMQLLTRYEDDFVVVLDKPAGIPAHPLRADEKDTLANGIIARWPQTENIGFAKREPGLLHRLDTDTSGLIVVAKTIEAFEFLRTATKEGRLTKRYTALAEGTLPSEGRIDYPLVPHRKDPKRVEAVTPHVRLRAGTRTYEAQTHYKPLRSLRLSEAGGGTYTLLEIEIESAFRHQIRVHFATIGHPLVGDVLYRGPSGIDLGLQRHFLHASQVSFPDFAKNTSSTSENTHTNNKNLSIKSNQESNIIVSSPLPEDLATALQKLTPVHAQ